MKELEPRKKISIFSKEYVSKYVYVFVIGLVLLLGVSYGLTFFVQNRSIATGSFVAPGINITVTNNSVNATGLTTPTTDQEGMLEYAKTLTITNSGTTDGNVEINLERVSGLNLTDLRYSLAINGAIIELGDVPSNGNLLNTSIFQGETLNVEVRLWPKTSYSGSGTTFVGELDYELNYLGEVASSNTNLSNAYVNFNCSGNTCEVWRIVKVENGRLVLTREADLSGATSRTDSGKYNSSLTFNDNSMITSVSTDNKNVYLAKTVKISGGAGTQASPYTLVNNNYSIQDEKKIATITYKNTDGTTTLGTQNIYYGRTNYVSKVLTDAGFVGWSDGTNNYVVGSTINVTTDTILNARIEVWAVNVSYDDSNTNFNCNDFQCAIEALNDYVG